MTYGLFVRIRYVERTNEFGVGNCDKSLMCELEWKSL